MIQENFIKIYEKSFQENWDLPALTDYVEQKTLTFADVAKEIARFHILFSDWSRLCQLVCRLYGCRHVWSDYRTYFTRFQSE